MHTDVYDTALMEPKLPKLSWLLTLERERRGLTLGDTASLLSVRESTLLDIELGNTMRLLSRDADAIGLHFGISRHTLESAGARIVSESDLENESRIFNAILA